MISRAPHRQGELERKRGGALKQVRILIGADGCPVVDITVAGSAVRLIKSAARFFIV